MKKKIMALGIVMLFFGLTAISANADEESKKVEKIEAEYCAINLDGSAITDKLALSKEDVEVLKDIIDEIAEKVQSTKDIDIIFNILEKNRDRSPVIINLIRKYIQYKLSHGRALVLSYGKGLQFKLFNNIAIKISKKVCLWHYNSKGTVESKTVIIRPLALDVQVLKGSQIGLMIRFKGLYINIHNKLPETSYTFFMGFARHIRGFDIPDPVVDV